MSFVEKKRPELQKDYKKLSVEEAAAILRKQYGEEYPHYVEETIKELEIGAIEALYAQDTDEIFLTLSDSELEKLEKRIKHVPDYIR